MQNTDDNIDETFTRTSPPLNRIVVKLGGPAPWEILTASHARLLADHHEYEGAAETARTLRAYAAAVDAMLRVGYPERDMQTTVEELGY